MDHPAPDAATEFERAVAAVLRATRRGEIVTYAEVAVEAGYSPRASRSVGSFLARHGGRHPWWRVVTATGRLVPGHEEEQTRRLRDEGVELAGGHVAGMAGRRSAPRRRPDILGETRPTP